MKTIELSHVTTTLGSGPRATTALRDCSLTAGAGEFVALTGKSGSGKTTLLRLMLYELSITSRWDRRILATLLGGTALTSVVGGILAASLSLAVVHLVLGPTGFVVAWDWAAAGWATLAVVAGTIVGFALGRRRS
ncbi:ATP-binding cassette domain-containing protein [Corynebacterium sp. LK2590]|uniref:ATP-binding cassette domain-containing protein n=1 Tax=unclassified Corynebacterium TaxID=2624378 RepID=UPI0034CF369A